MQAMRQEVDWDKRWSWPFENYAPIFELAKNEKIRLVALNVDSEDLAMVEKGGFPGIPSDRLDVYISDRYVLLKRQSVQATHFLRRPGFASFAQPREFATYVDYVIRPSYDFHQSMGLLKHTMAGEKLETEMSFRNFFSGRILWDEAMASGAYEWTKKNPGGLLVGLVGADHVKFRNGIPGRFSRMGKDSLDCISVILNPTLTDTRPPGSVIGVPGAVTADQPNRLTLQLRFLKDGIDGQSPDAQLAGSTGGVLKLADYLLVG